MVKDCHTISMDGSKYSWEQADKRADQLDLERSEYIYQLVEKDIDGKKRDYRIIDIIVVCILFVIILLLMGLVL
jgi:hypothetical protein